MFKLAHSDTPNCLVTWCDAAIQPWHIKISWQHTRPGQAVPFSLIFAIYMIMLGKAQGCKRAWLRDRFTRGKAGVCRCGLGNTCPQKEDLYQNLFLDISTLVN